MAETGAAHSGAMKIAHSGRCAMLALAACVAPAVHAALPAEAAEGLARGRLELAALQVSEQGQLSAHLQDRQGQGQSWPVSGCADLYGPVRARRQPVAAGTAAFPVQMGWGELRHAGRPVIDLATAFCEDLRTDAPAQGQRRVSLLSLVGPLLSFRTQENEARAGGPPYRRETWTTRDLRTGPALDIREVFEPEGLLAALRQDAVARRLVGASVLARAPLGEVLAALAAGAPEVSAFAVHHIDPASGRVAVRLAVQAEGPCGLCLNRVTQLGLWLQPRAGWLPYFRPAAEGGFTMSSRFEPREL